MELKRTISLKNMDHNKEVVERLVEENLNGKLDNYLQKFNNEDMEGTISLSMEKNKKELFNGALQINIDGNVYRYKREDFKKLDDLVNHLFDHFKEDLAKK